MAIKKTPDKVIKGVDVQACDGSVWGISQIFTTPFEAGMIGRDDMQKRIRTALLKAGADLLVN